MNSDQIEGKLKSFGGQAEKAVGDFIDDDQLAADGSIETAKGKAQEAYGTVKDKAAEAYEAAREKATDAYGKVRDTAKEWADEAPVYLDRAKETGRRYADRAGESVKTTVQEQPVATLLGGVAAGFLLGWLINSRRS